MSHTDSKPDSVAIVGMAARVPGARNHREFWKNLKSGIESISHFEVDELEVHEAARQAADPAYVRARAILDDTSMFDAPFFGIYPQEVRQMDPQHRVFLECCWEALEDAGHDTSSENSVIGVFAGCSQNSYFLTHVCPNQRFLHDYAAAYQVGHYTTMLGAISDTLATRVSYKLNLQGPSITVQTACSTSLVAVSQACTSLLTYQCDAALAGGVSISYPQKRGYLYQAGGMVSPDGHCRTFDEQASGTVFGSGAGVVLLKRLEDARRDGDHIYAVIRGWAINNDGSGKVGFTAPSIAGQAQVITMAQAAADVDPRSISYIEAHGTGTPLGDPIEIAALTEAFRTATKDEGFCAIGTAKTNVGHLDVAAGVVGLIKTAMSLEHKQIPGILHFKRPNPKLGLENSPFYINSALRDWECPAGESRRAGVSAFGVGGTNAHVVLEEAPFEPVTTESNHLQLFPFSARSPEALSRAVSSLKGFLEEHAGINLADAAYTLQTGRRAFEYRTAIVAGSHGEAISQLARYERSRNPTFSKADSTSVHFLFPGQGVQYPNMGCELYREARVYRDALDACAELLGPDLGVDLREVLFPSGGATEESRAHLDQTQFAQPAIFATEYALAKLWMSWGIRPASMIGHSVGEFVAACLAGVFTLPEALRLIAMRGQLMQSLPGGAMLSVRLSEAEILKVLPEGLDIAAINGPTLCVIAGPYDRIEALETTLTEQNVQHRRLHTSHAFHSSMMDPILAPFAACVAETEFAPPQIPYVSCVTGTWIKDEEATSVEYWARHFRQPVRFSDGIKHLRQDSRQILLEVGPGKILQVLARQQSTGDKGEQLVTSSIGEPTPAEEHIECRSMLTTLGMIWSAGIQPVWSAVQQQAKRKKVSMPTYPFAREHYWIEASEPVIEKETLAVAEGSVLQEKGVVMSQVAPVAERRQRFVSALIGMLCDLSGMETSQIDPTASFIELGFDSLFLTQVTQSLQGQFNVKVTFRQLMTELSSVDALADYLDKTAAPSLMAEPAPAPAQDSNYPSQSTASTPAASISVPQVANGTGDGAMERLMKEQLQAMSQLMSRQLEMLSGTSAAQPAVIVPPAATDKPAVLVTPKRASESAEQQPEKQFKAFGPYKPIQKNATVALTRTQSKYISEFVARYTKKTAASKELTTRYRPVLADPRVVAGFRAEWKEIVYPINTVRSKGSRLWDVDGNEYIDILNGFGPIALGHLPDFVQDAVSRQLEQGIEIGPQTPLAGEVASLLCELTGNERATFCNTGSEAVMAALRLARTVTGRKKVVMFTGDYHGNFEEVLVKRIGSNSSLRTGPIAPGITPEAVANVIVLDYGTPEALEVIRQQASQLAAVILEPVQSRHPNLQPKEFLQTVREITTASGTALIFDEVVTGFRLHVGGAQAHFGIRADMVTYGKVLGGGFPIGALAGKAAFMDALDGGIWHYGDDSFPEVGVTFFAGTFVRHPLAMAAARAVLTHLKKKGPALQQELTSHAATLVAKLNAIFERYHVPSKIETCGSWFYFSFPAELRFGSLFYYHLREKGIHILEGFPCFLTTAHTPQDMIDIERAFEESACEMQAGDLLPRNASIVAGLPDAIPSASRTQVQILEAPVTESQLEILVCAKLSQQASCSFNEAFTVSLKGALDEPALRASLTEIVRRHESLRSTFDLETKTVRFHPELVIEIPSIDLSTSADPGKEFERLVDEDAQTPFDLDNGPVVRIRIVRLAPKHNVVFFTSHHAVCDGWSTNIILSELSALYPAYVQNAKADLPEPLAFSQYARDLQSESALQSQQKVESYWLKRFEQLPPLLDLATDRPRAAVKAFEGATVRRAIGANEYRKIKKAGAAERSTLFVTLLAGFQALLGRLTGQDDLVVGIPAAGQSLLDGQTLVGHSVNLLPLRIQIAPDQAFSELLSVSRQILLDAYEHQQYTFGTLVRKLGLKRDPSRLPLVDVQFNVERFSAVRVGTLETEVDSCAKKFVNFDLFLNVVESEQGLILDLDYNTQLFDEATVRRWLSHYESLLLSAAENMRQPVSQLALLTEAERRELIVSFNSTDREYRRDVCVHELFEQQVLANPSATALVYENSSLSYAELDKRAGQLAAFLTKHGVAPGKVVALLLDRSLEMVIAMLATLKAGAAYLPLDPAYPKERVEFILDEAKPPVVLTQQRLALQVAATEAYIVCLDSEWTKIEQGEGQTSRPRSASEDLAYLIYTSGSTGKPKGVEIPHRAVVNFLNSMQLQPGFDSQDRLLAVTTLSFDIAGLEIFLPLVSGGCVVVASRETTTNGFNLARAIEDGRISVMQATPGTWRLLLEAGWKPRPGFKMLCGGEAFPTDLANELLATGDDLWNMYGPTETTIWSAVSRVQMGGAAVRIGPPIDNTQFYVLDGSLEPRPLGVPGELFIAGDGLARGYFKREALTSEKFLKDPFVGGDARMYRTGDLVRLLPTGYIEFLGRLDHQVKIRGFRIELGEIEATLMKHPSVAEAVVAVHDERGSKQLAAYYTSKNGNALETAHLRAFASASLPAYMTPAFFVHLTAMPRTPNGKINWAGLPKIEAEKTAMLRTIRAPRNHQQEQLVAICCEVLNLDKISIDDNLFEMGADSIQIFRIIARANRAGINLTAQQIMQSPTIETLADLAQPVVGAPAATERTHLRAVSRDAYRIPAPSQAGKESEWRIQ
jgi:amino acid adenylation domain-containing protein